MEWYHFTIAGLICTAIGLMVSQLVYPLGGAIICSVGALLCTIGLIKTIKEYKANS